MVTIREAGGIFFLYYNDRKVIAIFYDKSYATLVADYMNENMTDDGQHVFHSEIGTSGFDCAEQECQEGSANHVKEVRLVPKMRGIDTTAGTV